MHGKLPLLWNFSRGDNRGKQVMWTIKAELDWETGGTFQVIDLEDDDGNDLTDLVDQGRHFNNMEELKQAILKSISERLTVTEA